MLELVAGTILGIAGLAASVAYGRGPAREARQKRSIDVFLRTRTWLETNEDELRPAAQREHAKLLDANHSLPGFRGPDWRLDRPVELDKVQFTLRPSPPLARDHYDVLRRYWPRDGAGIPLDRYHNAISSYDAPENWFNGTSYRLLGITPTDEGGLDVTVGTTKYWDALDSFGALIFEAAHTYRKTGGTKISGPYRRRLRDPFDLAARECAIGFSVLTLRQAPNGLSFFLHRRDGRVATAKNRTGLIPAGEFQPSDDSGLSVRNDLDLWRAMMREYAEELLGMEEVRFRRGAPIDYNRESPFRQLQAARRRGTVRPYVIDVRIDPLSWKCAIIAVCIFNYRTFDRMFSGMVSENMEGILELPSLYRKTPGPYRGWPLNEDTLPGYLSDDSINLAVRTCLALTWRHRAVLGLQPPPRDES